MSNIRYICLSDMHFGQDDSILTHLNDNDNPTEIDLRNPSPALVALCKGLRDLVTKANSGQETQTTLILAGDIMETALATMNNASMVFQHFVEHIMPKGEEKLFDTIIYIPGNHDHHMWELGRETQYVNNYLWKDGLPFTGTKRTELRQPWHCSKMFESEELPLPKAYFLNNLIHRYDNLKDFNVSVAYPNLGLRKNKHCVMFHHGHFVEEIYHLMTELAMMLFPQQTSPGKVEEIEAENFAWIDFFWSAMGRSGNVGPLIENIYISLSVRNARDKLIKNLVSGLIRKHGHAWLRLMRKPIEYLLQRIADCIVARERSHGDGEPLSHAGEHGLKTYLAGPVLAQMKDEIGHEHVREVTFVFGHTHKPDERQYQISGYPLGQVSVYNTGGWVVEKTADEPLHGASVVLLDDELNVTSLRLYNEGKYEVQVKEVDHARANALTQHIGDLLNKTFLGEDDFSRIIADEVRKHKKYLKYRLNHLENG